MQIDAETQLTILKRLAGDNAVVIAVLQDELAKRDTRLEQQDIELTALRSAALDAPA